MARVIEICLIKALAWQAQGNTAAGLELLERSLSLAQPEGYVRIFLEHGAPVVALLRQAAPTGIAPDYVNSLIAAFEAEGRGSGEEAKIESTFAALGPRSPDLVEPLTKRELEVLRLLVRGLSNQEIAEALVIAVGTVKTHVHNIYGKLGVRDRPQAILRAGELNLV
jgi:LuxR family maltose regulon positive regulatory protein